MSKLKVGLVQFLVIILGLFKNQATLLLSSAIRMLSLNIGYDWTPLLTLVRNFHLGRLKLKVTQVLDQTHSY